jgi:GAF domain-containing protein
VSELARSAVGNSDQVGLTLMLDEKLGTYVFTEPDIPEIDRAQYDTGDGPCIHAYRSGERTLIPSTIASDDYPEFCAAAAEHGFLCVVSFPLATPKGRIGAMNHYSRLENAFGAAEIEVGDRFAQQAAFLLVNAQAYWDARSLSENLAEAMESRATIEQAKGIIMASTGTDPDGAFAVLKEQSQRENIKVRDIAEEIVRRSQR